MLSLNQQIKNLGANTSTEEFVLLIDTLKKTDQKFNNALLVDILSERHSLYKNRSSISSQRMRGYLIEAFLHVGLPQRGLSYILEELETSFTPYVLTASARAVRGLKDKMGGIANFLTKSIYNIWQKDSISNYSSFVAPYKSEEETTSLKEIFESLKWLGSHAYHILPDLHHIESHLSEYLNAENKQLLNDCIIYIENAGFPDDNCCDLPNDIYSQKDSFDVDKENIDLENIILQDQEGKEFQWKNFFHGKYTVVSFFYTQCHNPRKCLQTIYNLVDIQKELALDAKYKNIQTAAITYDPNNDSSSVLKNYGNNRKFQFNDNNKMFRVEKGMEHLIDQLNIGVNYKGDLVNVHRIEVYIINPEGKIEKSFLRFQAKADLILKELQTITQPDTVHSTNQKQTIWNKIYTNVLPLIIAFFPKCPMCWASYMNLLGLSGIITIPHKPWLIYIFIFLGFFNLWTLFRLSKKRNGLFPFYLALTGTTLIGLNYYFQWPNYILIIGMFFMLASTLLNSLSFKKYHQLMLFFYERKIALKFNF